jgi:hypothetical protein
MIRLTLFLLTASLSVAQEPPSKLMLETVKDLNNRLLEATKALAQAKQREEIARLEGMVAGLKAASVPKADVKNALAAAEKALAEAKTKLAPPKQPAK